MKNNKKWEQGFDDRYICKEHPREPKHYVDLEPEDVKQFLAQAIATQERELLEWVNNLINYIAQSGLVDETDFRVEMKEYLEEVPMPAQRRELGERENAK